MNLSPVGSRRHLNSYSVSDNKVTDTKPSDSSRGQVRLLVFDGAHACGDGKLKRRRRFALLLCPPFVSDSAVVWRFWAWARVVMGEKGGGDEDNVENEDVDAMDCPRWMPPSNSSPGPSLERGGD